MQQAGFARAVGADQADAVAVAHSPRDIPHDLAASMIDGDFLKLNEVHGVILW
jgi:hypothetical protein